MAQHPSHRTIDVLRKLCQDEVQAAIDPLRHEMTFLDFKWETAISDLRAEVQDLKQQLQASGVESQTKTSRSRPRLGHMVRHKEERVQDAEFTTLDNADEREWLFEAESSSAYKDILDHATVECELGADCWGAATLAIMKDMGDLCEGIMEASQWFRSGVIFVCWLLNLLIQVGLLHWTYQDILLPEISELQHQYHTFHSEAFISGKFDLEAFASLGKARGDICKMALTSNLFTMACVFLWASFCAHEVLLIFQRKRSVDLLPNLPIGVSPSHMCHEIKVLVGTDLQHTKNMIVCLNQCSRLMLNLFIFVPRIIVACCMLVVGTAFLTASASHTELILNSLAMAFIFDIDELIFFTFVPVTLKEKLGITYIVTPSEETIYDMRGPALERKRLKRAYARSAILFVSVMVFICSWFATMPILPEYEWDLRPACHEYLLSLEHILCNPWDSGCFPK